MITSGAWVSDSKRGRCLVAVDNYAGAGLEGLGGDLRVSVIAAAMPQLFQWAKDRAVPDLSSKTRDGAVRCLQIGGAMLSRLRRGRACELKQGANTVDVSALSLTFAGPAFCFSGGFDFRRRLSSQMNSATSNGHKTRKRPLADQEITFDERRAAKKIGVSYRSMVRYREQRLISFYRVGARILYDDSCLQEFLAKHRQVAA